MSTTSAKLAKLAQRALTPCWKNLNKLSWADGFAYESHGVRLGIRVSDTALLPLLRERLPATAEPSHADVVDRYFSVILGGRKEGLRVRSYNLLYLDHTLLARSFKLEDVLEAFETNVRMSVAELARGHVFIHAGVVGWKGRAILVPGKTLAGKTTLVAELVKAGAEYYSDEFAVLDRRGRVHPFPKPLSPRDAQGVQRNVSVEEIGGCAGVRPLPVGLVLMSEYKAGTRWRPTPLSPGNGVLALMSNAVAARRQPERTLSLLQQVASRATVIRGRRPEAASVARDILARIEQSRI